jgi:hypothetical protein
MCIGAHSEYLSAQEGPSLQPEPIPRRLTMSASRVTCTTRECGGGGSEFMHGADVGRALPLLDGGVAVTQPGSAVAAESLGLHLCRKSVLLSTDRCSANGY